MDEIISPMLLKVTNAGKWKRALHAEEEPDLCLLWRRGKYAVECSTPQTSRSKDNQNGWLCPLS